MYKEQNHFVLFCLTYAPNSINLKLLHIFYYKVKQKYTE